MLKHLGLDGWQAWDYAVARLDKRTETAEEGVSNMCDVCGSPNGKEHGATCPIAIAETLMVRELRKCQAGHRKPVVYVAGRFRSADGWKINENVFAAEKAGREVAALGAMPLVPHSIGAHMAGTEDDTFWLTGTLELMRRCDAVLVLPGYQESQGAMGEIAEAQRIGMPVIMPIEGKADWESLVAYLKTEKPLGVLSTCKQCGGWGETGYKVFKKECSACKGTGKARNETPEIVIQEKKRDEVTLDKKEAPNSYDTHSWWKLRNAAQRQSVGRLELAIEDACLFDGQVLTVERENGKSEVALHTVDESGECYIWLKDDSAICKLISALSLLAQGEGPVALMAEIAEKWQTKRLIDARDKADQTLAELGIELGQREGETLLAAARRVRETGTHAEVERLTQLLEAAKQDAEDTRVRTSARIEKLCQQSNAVAKALGDHHGKTDEEAALALVANLQEARERHNKVAAVAEKLHKKVEDQARELDELMAKWEQTKGQLASERTEHKEQQLFLRSLVNAGPDEALDVAIGKAMVRIKELTSERDSLRAEVTMLRSELSTQKAERIEDTLIVERDHYRGQLDLMATSMTKLRAGAGEVIADRDRLKHEVERLKAEIKKDNIEWGAATGKLMERLGAKHGESLDEVVGRVLNELTEQLGFAREFCDEALRVKEKHAARSVELSQKIHELTAERDSLRAQLGPLEEESDRLKAQLQTGRRAIVIPHRMADLASAGLVRALPLVQPSEQSPSPEASHITQAGKIEVTKALTRPADSSCTCHQNAPCSHCTWYADRGISEPEEAASGLVMQD